MAITGSKDPDVIVDINTTPLIDVLLVLLIMLIITIPIQMHAVKMDLPVSTTPPLQTQPKVVQIDIDATGTVSWDGKALPNETAIEEKLALVAAEPVQAELHLMPNKLTPYRAVAEVLAAAQRKGATKIGLTGGEQYMD